jgi:hypothetical protein
MFFLSSMPPFQTSAVATASQINAHSLLLRQKDHGHHTAIVDSRRLSPVLDPLCAIIHPMSSIYPLSHN